MNNTERISKITLEEKFKIDGFKVLFFIPFYVKHIGLPVQIKICQLKHKLQLLNKKEKPDMNDFYDHDLMRKSWPLIRKVLLTGLINGKWYNYILYPFLYLKISECNNRQIFSLYQKLVELADADFFLAYYQHLMKKDHTILKEE